MTLATKITVSRLFMVPIFAVFAIRYGLGTSSGLPLEFDKWAAICFFTLAAVSDGIDGWIARRFHQTSELGAFLDPIADKAIVLTAVLTLTFFDWGEIGWRIPYWFTAIVVVRDCFILGGIRYLYFAKKKVVMRPHWTGKASTLSLFIVLGWVMLQVTAIHPHIPCGLAAVFVLLSFYEYFRQGMRILRSK
jgi:CDP-diacylglycerol--glycerol-3-phosphate 3-phosphatidyltransferase